MKLNQKITDKANFMKSVLLCTGILALAGIWNADLRSQDDFKRGKKMQTFPLPLPLSTSYVALRGCYHSVKIFQNT